MFDPESLAPRTILRTWFEFVRASEILTEFIPGSDNRLAWREFHNKLRAYYFFEYTDLILGLQRDRKIHEANVVRRLACMDEADSIWAAEGFGRHYADSYFGNAAGAQPSVSQTFSQTARKYFVPFHSGMGLAFAEILLRSICNTGAAIQTEDLQKFFALCESHSQSGFVGAAYENLGLSCRTQYPEMIHQIDQLLLAFDTKMAAYFWHGVGRALFFLPTGFVPSSGWMCRALQKAQSEPPHALGRSNATAGAAWAFTLVNMREPRIMEVFLKNCGANISDGEAFVNGVQSALMIWFDSAGQDPFLRSFCQHRPDASDGKAVNLWDWYAGRPSRRAERDYPVVAAHGRIGELFRYLPLPMWIEELRGSSRS